MSHIRDDVEISIQEQLPKSTAIPMDGGILYTNIHFFRYVEASKHITGDCFYRVIGDPWYWLPWFFRELFQQKEFVLKFDAPVCWDNEDSPIPKEQLERVLAHVTSALKKRYRRYKIEFQESS